MPGPIWPRQAAHPVQGMAITKTFRNAPVGRPPRVVDLAVRDGRALPGEREERTAITLTGLLAGQTWTRIVRVVAVLSAVANFLFLPYYPFWSILVIALDVMIICALLVCGRVNRIARGMTIPAG
jgi:hypothetical protein